jgi:protocatechuate 3,4-dioxygenase alpha subunit
MTTPSQTVGPFFGYALPYEDGPCLVPADHPGAITLRGRVLDGTGDPLPDALVEIWQTDPSGQVPSAKSVLSRDGFSGFGRCPTDGDGDYHFTTVLPGAPSPYLAMLIFARGLLKPVATRVYFTAAAIDTRLSELVGERSTTLVAESVGAGAYRFDVHLQGEKETVFLDL